MIRPDSYPNSVPGDANFPYGSMKNITGVGLFDGFPFDKGWMNDYTAFFQRLMTEAGVSPSGFEDTVLVSDFYDSLEILLDLIDDKYLPNNVEKLLLNDQSVGPGPADIGEGYQSAQYYGRNSIGSLYFGRGGATVYVGREVTGDQSYGEDATGAIEVGSALGTVSTHKLITNGSEATFQDIITAAGASDRRFKTELKVIPNALEKVTSLTGYTFMMDKKSGVPGRSSGLIAQDVQKVLPEVVLDNGTEDHYLSIKYGAMMGLMVEAIKDLKKEIEVLKSNSI